MAEFVGLVAAVTQLAKYSVDIANGLPNFTRRMRNASLSVQQWSDHAALLCSLAQTLRSQPDLLDQSHHDIIDRCRLEAENLGGILKGLSIDSADGRFARLKKKLAIVQKEKEIYNALVSIGQRSGVLQQQLSLLQSAKLIQAAGLSVQTAENTFRLAVSLLPSEIGTKASIDSYRAHAVHVESILNTLIRTTHASLLSSEGLELLISAAIRLCQYHILMGRGEHVAALVKPIITWTQRTLTTCTADFDVLRGKMGYAEIINGQFELARVIMQSLLRTQVYAMGDNHIETLHSLNNLGVIYEDQGMHEKAQMYHEKALSIKQQLFGEQHLETFVTINNLALTFQSQKQHLRAEVLFRHALCGRQRLLSPEHMDIFVSMSNLGISLQLQGRLHQSKELHKAALAGRKALFGPRHYTTLKSKADLALVLHYEGQHDQSTQMMQEVSDAFKDTLRPAHPDTIETLRNLALFHYKQYKLQQAEQVYTEILSLLEDEFGRGHEESFDTLQHLSTVIHLQNRYEAAYQLACWLFEARCETLGPQHPDALCSRDHVKELEEDMARRDCFGVCGNGVGLVC